MEPIKEPVPGLWYLGVNCQKCSARMHLFHDKFPERPNRLHNGFIVTKCGACGFEGRYAVETLTTQRMGTIN